MSKRGISNSILLNRIDERTGNIQEDIQELKESNKISNELHQSHNSRLIHLEDSYRKNIHIPNNGSNKLLKFILGLFLKFK